MRNISFSLTTPQFLDLSKDVTRRLAWLNLKPGEALMACEKCQGIKPGEKVVKLGEITVITTRRERLDLMITDAAYGQAECIREGFPHLTPSEFVAMFCKHNKCEPSDLITRIEFHPAPVQDKACLVGLDLQPYQQRILDMMLSLPEGTKWRLMLSGRDLGSYAEKEGKLTHRWNGESWVSLTKSKNEN